MSNQRGNPKTAIRLTQEQRELITRAAKLDKRKVADFIRTSAIERAERINQDYRMACLAILWDLPKTVTYKEFDAAHEQTLKELGQKYPSVNEQNIGEFEALRRERLREILGVT